MGLGSAAVLRVKFEHLLHAPILVQKGRSASAQFGGLSCDRDRIPRRVFRAEESCVSVRYIASEHAVTRSQSAARSRQNFKLPTSGLMASEERLQLSEPTVIPPRESNNLNRSTLADFPGLIPLSMPDAFRLADDTATEIVCLAKVSPL